MQKPFLANLKPTIIRSCLFLGLLLFVAGCPQSAQEDTTGQSTGQSTSQSASGKKISFAPTQLTCCWESLLEASKKNNLDYNAQLQKALSGDAAALEALLLASKQVDQELSFPHGAVLVTVLYAVGDKAFAQALKALEDKGELKQEQAIFQETFKETLRNLLESGHSFTTAPELKGLSLQDFPQTSSALGYTLQSSQ
jgi:hypothetical protein